MTRSIFIEKATLLRVTALFAAFTSWQSTGLATTWVWVLPEYGDARVITASTYREARSDLNRSLDNPPSRSADVVCEGNGWVALVRPWLYEKNGGDFGGACGKSTKTEALKAALKSCNSKPRCAELLQTRRAIFGYRVWYDNSGSYENFVSCSDDTGRGYKAECEDSRAGNPTRFDKSEFLSTYSQ